MRFLLGGILRVSVRFCSITSQHRGKSSQNSLQLLRNSSLINNFRNTCVKLNTKTEVAHDKAMSVEKEPFRRLPSSISPYHYEISLTPDLSTFKFDGNENIHVDILETTDTVILNSVDINIKKVSFCAKDGEKILAEKCEVCNEKQLATIKFPEKLPLGKTGYLTLDFQGELNDTMKGFYKSKYTSNGVTKYAAVTQFEAIDARRCFPCWDEPALKATFDITLTVPTGLTALSNMPVKTKNVQGSQETLVFERSPKMSTYLVAIVVGEFDYIEGKSSDGVVVRVYTPKGQKEQGRFALEVSTKVLPYYNKYFGIPYPLMKMDLIAIPDFSAGAMENWGLITYRESCLLVDPENTSSVNKQWIVVIVSHEIAHQWFGNLVTMEWWTHLWLNEGYASFMECLCVADFFPQYDIWTQFVTDVFTRALELDALKNSHPVQVSINNPEEIDEIFDDISYNKGASIIRMLHSYIGDEDFRKGMSSYLKKYSYANTETEDLWTALEASSNKPVGKIMSLWTKQTGFPLLKVEQREQGTNRILSFSQQRFLADGSSDNENNFWMIPISISTSENPKRIISNTIMGERTTEISLSDIPENAWVKVNPGTIGFYRTHYSPEMLALFLPSIKDRSLPPLDRYGLLDDLFSVAKSGQASIVEVLQLLQAYEHEDNYTVWSNIVSCLAKVNILLSHLDIHDKFKAFSRRLLKDVARRVGWEPKPNESHLDTVLRSLVLGQMAILQDEDTVKEAMRRFQLHVTEKSILPADLRSPVYRAVLSGDGAAEIFENMLALYRKTDLHEEKDRILAALGIVKDEALLTRVMNFALSDEVRAQDTIYVFPMITMTHKGRLLAWQFVRDNWASLFERCQSGMLIGRLVRNITENFVTEEKADEVEAFFAKHSQPGIERTVHQCIEKIRLSAAWLRRDRDAIEEFLRSQA